MLLSSIASHENKVLHYRRETHTMLCALYQSKYWPTVVWITRTDRVLAWGALSATATLYSATCVVLYLHCSTIAQRACGAVDVNNILPYHQPRWYQLDRNCDHQIRLTPELLMTVHISPPALRHGHGLPWRTDTNFWQYGVRGGDFSSGQKMLFLAT